MLLEKTWLIKWVRLGSWSRSYWSKVDDAKFYRALKFMVRSDTAAVEFSLGLFLALWKKRIVVVSRIWNLFSLSRARINQVRFLLHHSMVLTRQGLKYLFLDALFTCENEQKAITRHLIRHGTGDPDINSVTTSVAVLEIGFITDYYNLCNLISRERVF